MLQGITAAAERRPGQKFEWRHLGTGSSESVVGESAVPLPRNLSVEFIPYGSQAAMFDFYRQNRVDVFLNVSSSEGTPMTIMEAASCSIPVIATAVGGNVEIVSERNGILLSADPTPEQIADALLSHWDQPGGRRSGSLDVWRTRYNADINYPEFARRLVQDTA
jgi:glycosyltransferase involved in cell wall biosynthesis